MCRHLPAFRVLEEFGTRRGPVHYVRKAMLIPKIGLRKMLRVELLPL